MDNRTYDKIYACWLGKNIGGTLGGPVEGNKSLMNLTFYPQLSENGSLPNDDLDLQLVNLHAIEEYGLSLTAAEMGREWAEHVYFPYDEYGYGTTALRLGFTPPFSGTYDNPFTNCMGSPIRSELWAAVAMENPSLAAYFAWQDAVVDHAGADENGGEGVYGEMFYAALESMAYGIDSCEGDEKPALIRAALDYIPTTCRVYAALSDMLLWYDEGSDYLTLREKILQKHGRANFTDAPQNLAFTMMGFLFGENFEDGILKAVNLGYDTDCTGATLGALYGIIYGRSYIPEKWSAPIGQNITVSDAVRGFDAPRDLDELTKRTIRIKNLLALEDTSAYKADEGGFLWQRYVFPSGARAANNMNLTLRYIESANVEPYSVKKIALALKNNSHGKWRVKLSLVCPEGFIPCEAPHEISLESGNETSLELSVRSSEVTQVINRFAVRVERYNDGSSWNVYDAPFTLIRSSKWTLDGIERYIGGTTLTSKIAGKPFIAETTLYCPVERETRLMFASHCPISAEIDGKIVVNAENSTDYMPAYHRCGGDHIATLRLTKGEHKIKITAAPTDGEKAMFTFAPLATHNVSDPGSFYRYIDDIIG